MFVMDITKYKVLMSKALCLRNLDRMFSQRSRRRRVTP